MLGAILAATLVVVAIGIVWLLTPAFSKRNPTDPNPEYIDPATGSTIPFPHLSERASVYLTIVFPAYNEEERLPPTLDETIQYLKDRQDRDPSFTFEIIVVDDGSKDRTAQIVLEYSSKYGTKIIRLLKPGQNGGKGCAVRLGVNVARGQYILFADADGATSFPDIEKLEAAMKALETKNSSNGNVVVGSRNHLLVNEKVMAKRSQGRNILMHGFHFLVWLFAVRTVRDTQCGFKLFSRKAARIIFPTLYIDRWCFDVEVLYRAEAFGMGIKEVAVNWTEIAGSKLNWKAPINMGRELLLISFLYALGFWKLPVAANN